MNTQMMRYLARSGKVSIAEFLSVELGYTTLPAHGYVHALPTLYFRDVCGGFLMHAKLLQSCMTLCDPMGRSPPGSSVHEILQARVLEWAAISFSGVSF